MLFVRRARVPVALLPPALVPGDLDQLEPAVLCDITIKNNRIAAVAATGVNRPLEPHQEFDAAGALVFPAFADAHVHLDKTHTWHRAPNRSGTFFEALTSLGRDIGHWNEADLYRRAGFALRTAWAQGTRAIRTHVDTGLPWAEVSHAVMAQLREEWRGRIDLQTIPLCGGDAYTGPDAEKIADVSMKHGASALGAFLTMSAALPQQLDRMLAIARERGVGVDFHVDENDNPAAECLRQVAKAVLRAGFSGPVVCGHCCNLAVQDPERARSTIALVKSAGIGIISLPLCNLYLQDRRSAGTLFPRTPLWRGLTLIQDFLDAGVPVACASDNVRDAFHAFGDYDLAEVYVQSVRLAHLDSRLMESVCVVTSTAYELMGYADRGRISSGAPAQLVVFTAHRFSELLSRPPTHRRCIDNENVHTPTLPDFAELADRTS